MGNPITKTLRMNMMNMTVVFMGIEVGRRAVVLWALTIVMSRRRGVTRELNSGLLLLGRAVIVGRANVLLGVILVG